MPGARPTLPPGVESSRFLRSLERGELAGLEPKEIDRPAVFGSTPDNEERHFIGWADEVDQDKLFDSGKAWGLTVVRQRTS